MEIDRLDNSITIKLEGEVCFYNIAEIKSDIKSSIIEADKEVVLDLSKVTFLDNAGLALFVSLYRDLNLKKGNLVIEYPQLGVQKLLEMTRIDQMIKVRKTPEKTTGDWNSFD